MAQDRDAEEDDEERQVEHASAGDHAADRTKHRFGHGHQSATHGREGRTRPDREPGQERDLLLVGLFELRITHAEDGEKGAQIQALVVKLGGDPDAAFFGAYRHSDGAAPAPEYPADDTDEG